MPAEFEQTIAWLRTPQAIRQRCAVLLEAAEADRLAHFAYLPEHLERAVEYVKQTIELDYPSLDIPYHSRWRHFAAGGIDRWGELASEIGSIGKSELGRIQVELVIVSVLLDAGAGAPWRFLDPRSGAYFSRSEGLALASLEMYRRGCFSADGAQPHRVDAATLAGFGEAILCRGFQVDAGNPLVGVNGRTALLRKVGAALTDHPEVFGPDARLGNLYDHLCRQAHGGKLPAATILQTVLVTLGDIWPGRIELGGVNLGDVWRHPAIVADDATRGLVPFHKLSQWLSYSLLEPLQDAGTDVTDLDQLTGLPEYRNGGLLIDLDVLHAKHDAVRGRSHTVDSEVVVEWRGLTVGLLDRIAERLRERLGLSRQEFPLAKVLQGGTWSAGRRIARERRADGSPPLTVTSDGTVF